MLAATKKSSDNVASANSSSRSQKIDDSLSSITSVGPGLSEMPLFQRKACACGGYCPDCQSDDILQPKLTIGQPNDRYEQEANRVADQVLHKRQSDNLNSGSMQPDISIYRKPQTDNTFNISTFFSSGFHAPKIINNVLSGSGEPLDEPTRQYMEPRFGRDFSNIRIHRDSQAQRSAKAINAQAYTVGNRIVFGANSFQPDTQAGRHLLAHELTHTVQQGGDVSGSSVDISTVQRLMLSEQAVSIAAENMPRVGAILEEYSALLEAGAIASEEAAVITTAAAEAETAVAAAAELAATGATAMTVGEGALVVSAGIVADDVTGIGVADDVALPFTLLAAAAGLGIGAGLAYYYRDEIEAAWRAAADAVAEVMRLVEEAIRRHSPDIDIPAPADVEPVPQPETQTLPESQPRTSTGTDVAPYPDVDIDTDERRRRRNGCTYESIGQQFGRYPCHAAYATSLSGVPREMRVTTPEYDSADFDAIDHSGALYEVKTGYRWLAFTSSESIKQSTIYRFYAQAANQLVVSARCEHSLDWYFNDPYAASFFGAENSPHPDYFEAPMPVPVWYAPYDCNQDSDG
ncbi:MAG: DUF4157 domain-containing protein [Pseudomonadota bacterium]|nr:DUF4157 domain-containing protein [Pseudomonadota bacterium]